MQISVEHLTLKYENTVALKDISFTVAAGDYLCILGPNGSGKSTLLKAMLGLVNLDDGTIRFGDNISRCDLGYLPQQTTIKWDFPASVWEVVLSGALRNKGRRPFYSQKAKDLAAASMDKLSIGHLRGTSFQELSGGQRQRVLLARALCSAGAILLLDEPVAGLDPPMTASLYELIAQLNREDGLTVIMVSHDIGGALQYANKILHLEQSIGFFGDKGDYLTSGVAYAQTGGGRQ